MSENIKKGGISVETQNIFPVIKKWLYSDKDIFVRELVSNACDAVTKHKRLVSLGEASSRDESYRVDVILDTELYTLTFKDNGIGMDEDEIDKYINQIALSGAVDFIEKYEGKSEDAGNGIIGHFGLGFYSAFMIADKVEIFSRSYKDGAKAVHWTGSDDGSFEMENCDKQDVGTEIVLHINETEKDYATESKIGEILDKFCSFMPVEIYYTTLPEKVEEVKDGEEAKEKQAPKPVNDTTPLWLKKPSECTEEEYKEFYRKVFNDYKEPLFWIHISADYPLNFKGILYFPKLDNEFGNYEGQVKLYYNQVFVADNIKEVIPEYMFLLKGVLDCPELPLNVSRSYLQSNGYVSKISAHIVKKVSDKINSLFNTEREKLEGFWQDVKPFVEYACIRDEKFYDKVNASIMYKTTDGKYVTLKEYAQAEDFNKSVYYTDDTVRQSKYIGMFTKENIAVMEFDKMIDVQFISFCEHKLMTDSDEKIKDTKFVRVDSGFADALKNDKAEKNEDVNNALCEFFKETLGKGDNLKISCDSLKDNTVPALLNFSEQSRRFADMMKMYGGNVAGMGMPEQETLVINTSNALVEKISERFCDQDSKELCQKLAKQVYMLALVAQRPLDSNELASFIDEISGLLAENL
ncbi:MAG: molecular chaperone HtpG [Clostridia bacterium]|nr:molecular chaperone HtpG [Clostridia bacterium]